MNDESHEGWANRETWAANLWMENNKPTYDYVMNAIRTIKSPGTMESFGSGITQIEGWFRQFFQGLKNKVDSKTAAPSTMYALIEIGSVDRINFRELAEYWVDKTIDIYRNEKIYNKADPLY